MTFPAGSLGNWGNAETAFCAATGHSVCARGFDHLRSLPRQAAAALRAPAWRSLDLSRPLQCADVCGLGGAEQAGDPGRAVSRAQAPQRELGDYPRRGRAPVRRRLHPRGREEQRLGLLLVLQERLEALLPEMVRRLPALGAYAVPEDGGAAQFDSERA